jgi:hypothetical protein
MATKKNIIVGAASLYIGPSWDGNGSSPAPAFPVADEDSYRPVVAADSDWRDIGYTTDGLTVGNDPSFTDVQVDQLLDAAKIFKDSMGFSVSTTLVEATLLNLLIVWGQSDGSLTSSGLTKTLDIEGGGLGDAPLERGLIAVGNAPEKVGTNDYGERSYHVYRVLSVEGAEHSLSRSEATGFPVSFRALPADNTRYGTIVDRMGVA